MSFKESLKSINDVENYNSQQNEFNKAVSLFPDEIELKNQIKRTNTILSNQRSYTEKEIEDYCVVLNKDDPEAMEFRLSPFRKWYITMLISVTSVIITALSSVWTFEGVKYQQKFHFSEEVDVLGISLFIFGLGEAFLMSSLSEYAGRKVTFLFSLTGVFAFIVLTIWSNTLAGVLLGRFFCGLFGSAFLSVSNSVISDIFSKHQIGVPSIFVSSAPFLGPAFGPLIGAAFRKEHKWGFYVLLIATFFSWFLILLTYPETYRPVLTKRKAKRIRKETGDDKYFSALEIDTKNISFFKATLINCQRPMLLLFKDPMVFVLCFYTGLCLSIIYMFFIAFPIIYIEKVWNFTEVQCGLCYMSIATGIIIAAPTSLLIQKRFIKKVAENNGVSEPEWRLESLKYGGIITPIGLLIFAWTLYNNINWFGSLVGAAIFGIGVFFSFTSIFSYLIDAYRLYAASAMAANSLMRSYMSGIFPLFTRYMFNRLGVNWAVFLIAMICVCMVPIPFVIIKYGSKLRARSPYAWNDS
ncbi:hypothetical protein QEN19_001293 [Hanseniaspora menglaensis]